MASSNIDDQGRRSAVDDHVRIASITKTFTATLILRLVDKGKLSLDDHLADYVKGIKYGQRITIRQMLNMTSGVFSYTEDEAFGKHFDANPLDAVPAVGRHRHHQGPRPRLRARRGLALLRLQLPAPRRHRRAGDRPAHRPAHAGPRHRPAATSSTPATRRHPPSPGPAAAATWPKPDGSLRDVTAVNPDVAAGAGAMISTLDDLASYAKALADGTILSRKSQRERLQIVDVKLSPTLKTGYGLGIFDIQGFLGHDGAIYGYSTAMFHLPAKDATIVVIGNQSTNFTTPSLDAFLRIAQLLFPGRFPPAS